MTFEVAAESYDRFMGRFSEPLAHNQLDVLRPVPGQRALDVGSGPGAFTGVLVERLGAGAVTAVDPSASFVAAVLERFPGVSATIAAAEDLPFDDGEFDLAVAQLVVHFMTDPVAGLREMARVTRSGGVVAACVWDHAGGSGPLSTFWSAVNELHPGAHDESGLAGTREGDLERLFGAAGFDEIRPCVLHVDVPFADFGDWWAPYEMGVGPAGAYVTSLDPGDRAALRDRCAALLPDGPFEVRAAAWCVSGRV